VLHEKERKLFCTPSDSDGAMSFGKKITIGVRAASIFRGRCTSQENVYAMRGSDYWDNFLGLLIEFNQSWVKSAAALFFVASRTHSGELGSADQKPIHSHSFDAGAAWASIALQAHLAGYKAHGMTGVDFDKAPEVLGIPNGFRVECAVAIGKIGDKNQLPKGIREREVPSSRKPLSDVAFNGIFIAR
jgi:hypothetical protein